MANNFLVFKSNIKFAVGIFEKDLWKILLYHKKEKPFGYKKESIQAKYHVVFFSNI